MNETMQDCYLSQFDCLDKILHHRKELLEGFVEYYQSVDPDRIYLIGSGTSYNACSAAAFFMETVLGVEVTSLAPTCADRIYGKRPLVLAVSQSGRSTNTVGLVQSLREKGIPVITLTDPKETPVGEAASFAMHLYAENEQVGPKTRGYMATVLMLYLMAMEAGVGKGSLSREQYEEKMAFLKETVKNGPTYLETCQAFYDTHFEHLKSARHYLFVGKGISAKVAAEDALKVLETLCYPSSGYEFEEFLHGPACCSDEQLALFFYLPQDQDAERMLRMAGIANEITENCYLVSHDPALQGDKVLFLPSPSPAEMSPFMDVLFGQLLSVKLTQALGRARHPAVQDIFSRMGTKVPQKG